MSTCKVTYLCEICGVTFQSKKSNLNIHLKKFHNVVNECESIIKCLQPSCGFQCFTLKELRDHLMNKHQQVQEVEHLEFGTMQDFQMWKDCVEISSSFRWVKHGGSMGNATKKLTIYYCNRSGKKRLIDDKKRKRSSKSQGSNKVNASCTSSIVVTEHNSTIEVTFFKSHYGHDADIAHVSIHENHKRLIASQLLQGIPSTEILNKIRESFDGNFERVHLVTKKDINNIAKSFNIHHQAVKDENDAVSVKLWVNEQLANQEGCENLYKEQYSNSNLMGINNKDLKKDINLFLNNIKTNLEKMENTDILQNIQRSLKQIYNLTK